MLTYAVYTAAIASLPVKLFVGVDVRWGSVGQHQGAHRGRGDLPLSCAELSSR
jgi:hypothetical protein